MPQTIWHSFSGQLSMLFQMVWSVLLTVFHLKTLLLIGCEISTANQNLTNKWFLMATQRAKRSTPSERAWALKTELKFWCQIVCGILFDLIYSMTSSEGVSKTSLPLSGDFMAASIRPASNCVDFGSWANPLENAAKASACFPKHWRATPYR